MIQLVLYLTPVNEIDSVFVEIIALMVYNSIVHQVPLVQMDDLMGISHYVHLVPINRIPDRVNVYHVLYHGSVQIMGQDHLDHVHKVMYVRHHQLLYQLDDVHLVTPVLRTRSLSSKSIND